MNNHTEANFVGPEYFGISVECPFCIANGLEPAPEHVLPISVLLETELGRSALTPLIRQADELRNEGVELAAAVDTSFGDNLHRNEDGEIIISDEQKIEELKISHTEEALIALHDNSEDSTETVEVGVGGEEGAETTGTGISVDSYEVSESGGVLSLVGEVTNNQSEPAPVRLKATFLDDTGAVLGTATCEISSVESGATSDFTLSTSDNVEGYESIDLRVV